MTKHFRIHDKHLHNNVRKICFLKFLFLDFWNVSFVYRDIKSTVSNPWSTCDNIWSRIKELKLKTRRPNFANVSNEKTRVPLEAMSLKLRDLKRCGQVIWILWGIPIGFYPKSAFIKLDKGVKCLIKSALKCVFVALTKNQLLV